MLISVYIPTKNRAALLEAAIQSVLGQTHEEVEVVVTDDGSTDQTPQMLEAMSRRDPRVRWLRHERSQGGSAARNAAIRATRGDFVTGLDDDDLFTPQRLERFVQAWAQHETDGTRPSCLYSNLCILQHGRLTGRSDKPAEASFEDLFRENIVGNQIFAPRQHYLEAGLFREGLPAWQDLEFFMRMLRRFGSARLVAEPTYLWDNSPRTDRVSREKEDRMREACDTVARLHAGGDARLRQQLYLQLFGHFYGVKPKARDYRAFMVPSPNPRGLLRLLRASMI